MDPNDGQKLIVIRRGRHPQLPVESPEPHEAVAHPTRLLRLAAMVRELLEELRRTPLDEPGRVRLRDVHDRIRGELGELLSEDLQHELQALDPPLGQISSESEILLAHAQLTGWLEGLFQGIEAALWTQYLATQAAFEEDRRRAQQAQQARAERQSEQRYM